MTSYSLDVQVNITMRRKFTIKILLTCDICQTEFKACKVSSEYIQFLESSKDSRFSNKWMPSKYSMQLFLRFSDFSFLWATWQSDGTLVRQLWLKLRYCSSVRHFRSKEKDSISSIGDNITILALFLQILCVMFHRGKS